MSDGAGVDYEKIADELLGNLRDQICRPCVECGENLKEVNLENPLECECLCDKVEGMLKAARGIKDNIYAD